MSMQYIEGKDGLNPLLGDPDKTKVGSNITLPSVAEHAFYAFPEGLGIRSISSNLTFC